MSEPAINFALIQAEKRSRFDPLKGLTPELLVQYMDEFRAGHPQNLARIMDAIEERDDVLISVVPKAKASVARHGWEVLTVDTDSDADAALAAKQQEALEFFYNNLRATSALDQDELGGMSLLIRQMMDAKGKRYAVHNIVWQPKPGGNYTATFHFAPLWFFENTVGKMRFISQPFGFYGQDMEPGAWLVTKGQGVMIACAVAWMYKRLPMRDWLVYSSRHGLPGIEGVTDAAKGSEEWQNVVAAVEAAASEFKWVRNRNSEIKPIQFGADGQLPFPPLVERMDRALATIWRGGDLSTLSKDGGAIGSNPQASEATNIEEDDAAWISETLQLKIDRLVLDYIFGPDAPTLAYVKILTAKKQNTELDLKIDEFAASHGHPVSRKQFAERYNRPLPDDDDELLTAPAAPQNLIQNPPPPEEVAANEAGVFGQFQRDLATDLSPIVTAVSAEAAAIAQVNDPEIRKQRVQALLAKIDSLAADAMLAPASAESLVGVIVAGLAAGGVAVNEYDPDQARDETGKWVETGRAAIKTSFQEKRDVANAMTLPDTGPIDFRYGDSGEGIAHIHQRAEDRVKKFGSGPSGDEVLAALPETLVRGKLRHLNARVAAKEWTDSQGREWRALLAKDFHGAPANTWLLSGYDVNEKKGRRK